MSNCRRRMKWAGGESDFDLGHPRVIDIIEGNHGALSMSFMVRGYALRGGVFPGQYGDTAAACLKRFTEQVYSISDIKRVFELALWGGGTPIQDVFKLVDEHIVGKPLRANAVLALEILSALFVGGDDARASA